MPCSRFIWTDELRAILTDLRLVKRLSYREIEDIFGVNECILLREGARLNLNMRMNKGTIKGNGEPGKARYKKPIEILRLEARDRMRRIRQHRAEATS